MKKIIVSFIALFLCFGFSMYQSDSVQASMNTEEYSNEKVPFEMRFYNDSSFENNLFISGDSIFISENHTTASPLTVDLITEPLTPGTYVITCDMVGLSSDEFLYEIGGNIYDRQNRISLPTTWNENGRTVTAKFTITTPTNRLSLGEGGTYIRVNEAEWGHRRVMSVSLEKDLSDIPVHFTPAPSMLLPYDNKLILLANHTYTGSTFQLFETDLLNPGTYELTVSMEGLPNDEFYYQLSGNIYDREHGISFPTTWTEDGNKITAEFTITTPASKFSLGDGGTYISAQEAINTDRTVMALTLKKK